MNTQNVEFIRGAARPSDFLRDPLPQAVFAGRSNVGKSSVINCILNRRQMARVGSSPGKTRQINYFLVDKSLYIVDLPGYGYARVSAAEKQRWARLMEAFFSETDHISLGVLIVDARHKPTADDVVMFEWFRSNACPCVVLANKLDKLKKSEIEPNLSLIRETLDLPDSVRLIPFSAEKGTGRGELISCLEALL
ncbi:MAG: YihA family ribosome biogenesis GTP-binding protein [Oscillospiraceae bacterium]|nr:YihA family ribosome biogenesis GTP-binding protein [Oscillospiraceae bacterium]